MTKTGLKAHIRKTLVGMVVAFGAVTSHADEPIRLLALAPADVERFLSGWGSDQCTARLISESGQLIGIIRERNSLLVKFPAELQGLVLEQPRYSKNNATYAVSGQSDFHNGINSRGVLEITTFPRLASEGTAYSYSASLSLNQIGSTTATMFPVRIVDGCGAKSRLAYGPGGAEKILRFIAR